MRTFPWSNATRGLQYAITITQPNITIRITTHYEDVEIGGQTFAGRNAVNITNIVFAADGTPSNADVRVAAARTGSIKPGLGARGLIDGLAIKIEMFDPSNPGLGTFDMMPGATIGSVSEDTNRIVVFAVQGRLSLMKAPAAEIYTIVCKARLGDARCKVPLAVDDVARNTAYKRKDTNNSNTAGPWDTWVRKNQSGYNDRVYECTTAGTTAGSAPTYPTTIGATVTDGTAVFTCRLAYLNAATGQALDFFNIQLDADPAWDVAVGGNYTLGNIIPRSGDIKDTLIPIKNFDSGTLIVTLWQPYAPNNFPPGTVFEIHPGCDRLYNTCRDVFNNLANFRGTPYAPNSDSLTGRS